MEKIVIMRFGPQMPIREINEALKPHFANDLNATAIPVPGGVLSVFNTESTPEEVSKSLKRVDRNLPFFVMPYNENLMQIPGLTSDESSDVEDDEFPSITVNEILDKISTNGIASLTEIEKAILEGRA